MGRMRTSQVTESAGKRFQGLIKQAGHEGKTLVQIASEHGVSVRSLYNWSRRIRSPQRGRNDGVYIEGARRPLTWVKVERKTLGPSQVGDSRALGLVVEIQGARIRVQRKEDIGLMVELLRALSGGEA